MNRRDPAAPLHRWAVGWLWVIALCWSPLAGAEVGTSDRVRIVSPDRSRPVFGAVLFRVVVDAPDRVEHVILRVDGRQVAILGGPPFEAPLDLEHGDGAHTFEAIVDYGLETARVRMVTPRIELHDEISIELRQLYVTVTRAGETVPGLERDDFEILDGGATQDLVTFGGGEIALEVALLVDASISMEGSPLRFAAAGILLGSSPRTRVLMWL